MRTNTDVKISKDIETVVKTVFYLFGELEEGPNTLSTGMKTIKDTKIKLLEMRTTVSEMRITVSEMKNTMGGIKCC